MTTQLVEDLEGYPLYSQDGKGKEAVCRAVFALGSVRWFILEGNREDDDVILFGIVVGLMEDEYGYISLNELSDVELDLSAQGLGKLQVRQQQDFNPVPLKQIQDSRLQDVSEEEQENEEEIINICIDLYDKAAEENKLDDLEIIRSIVNRLGENGYSAVDSRNQINMTEPEKVVEFCEKVDAQEEAELTKQ